MARSYGQNLIEDEEGFIRPRVPQVIDARAPMADLSRNKPMTSATPAQLTAPSLTPKSVWDATFRNRFTGTNPLAQAQPTNPVSAFGTGLRNQTPPTLTTLAAGGMNHQQMWMNGATGQQKVAPFVAPGTTPSTVYDSTPGTRQPFIAGANGVNVGPSIAAAVSQNDPTLDRNYVNKANGVPNLLSAIPDWKKPFSWASAFNR